MLNFNRLPTSTRLYLMLLFPLLGLAYFAISSAVENLQLKDNSSKLQAQLEISVAMGSVIHDMQIERGLSAGFVTSGGKNFKAELERQRLNTDSSIKQLQQVASKSGLQLDSQLSNTLGSRLNQSRSSINNLTFTPKDSFTFYTNSIEDLIQQITVSAKYSSDSKILTATTAYIEFLRGKEFAGMERATVNGVLVSGQFNNENFPFFMSIVAVQDSHLKGFRNFATQEQIQQLDRLMQSNSSTEVQRIRQVLLQKSQTGNFEVSPAHWFSTITTKIDLMKEIENQLANYIMQLGEEVADNSNWSFWRSIIILVSSMGIAIYFGLIIIRSLSKELGGEPYLVRSMANEIAAGNLSVEISPKEGDNKSLLAALAFMRNQLHKLVATIQADAQQISSAAETLSKMSARAATNVNEQ